jgi:hypothetical protein
MDLARDGAEHVPAALTAAKLDALRLLLSPCAASARLMPMPALPPLLRAADAVAAARLPGARPVFARVFDKTSGANWSLTWHQDRTIALKARRDTPGFTAWTVKQGIAHAVPPFAYLQRMLILRLHLDDTGEHQAPLLVAPGSHRLGRLAEADIPAAVERCGTKTCLAAAGDIWVYAAPILHASGPMRAPGRRRILQLAYSADDLPGGLEWLGI